MKKISVTAAGVLLAAMVCGAASAQEAIPTGSATYDTSAVDSLPWYVSGKVGVALPGTIDVSAPAGPFLAKVTGHSTFDAGFAGSIAVGKYITPQVRAELELGVARNSGRSFEGTLTPFGGPASGPLTGDVTTTTLMAIGYYEFTQFGNFVPYLSAGVGGANVNSDLTFDDTVGFSDGTTTGSSTVLAVRIGAGFQFKIADSLDVTVDYAALFGGDATFTYAGPGGFFTRDITSKVMGHALAIGIKGSF